MAERIKATNDFAVEEAVDGTQLTRDVVEGLEPRCVPGLCIADPTFIKKPRDLDFYDVHVLQPLLDSGVVGDGVTSKFDDRKMRLHSKIIKPGVLEIALGHSHFLEFRTPIDRPDEANLALQAIGESELNERYAFFPRSPGIAGIVISSEGAVYVGERKSEQYDGVLNAVAGHLDFEEHPTKVDLQGNLVREIEEEFHVKEKHIEKLVFVGGFMNPIKGDMDFSYIAFTEVPNKHFDEVRSEEHKGGLIKVPTYEDVQRLLEKGDLPGSDKKYGVMYSTRGALMSIKKEEMAA